jgi:hypothetical protein
VEVSIRSLLAVPGHWFVYAGRDTDHNPSVENAHRDQVQRVSCECQRVRREVQPISPETDAASQHEAPCDAETQHAKRFPAIRPGYLAAGSTLEKRAAAPFLRTPFSACSALPPLRSGQLALDEAEHLLHNRNASVATPMVFGLIPECRSDSLRSMRSGSPESPVNSC